MSAQLLMKLKKAELKVLERIFEAETMNLLPAQFRSKHLSDLEGRGMVAQLEIVLPGRFPVRVKGWQLTEFGRFMFCQSCPDVTGLPE